MGKKKNFKIKFKTTLQTHIFLINNSFKVNCFPIKIHFKKSQTLSIYLSRLQPSNPSGNYSNISHDTSQLNFEKEGRYKMISWDYSCVIFISYSLLTSECTCIDAAKKIHHKRSLTVLIFIAHELVINVYSCFFLSL